MSHIWCIHFQTMHGPTSNQSDGKSMCYSLFSSVQITSMEKTKKIAFWLLHLIRSRLRFEIEWLTSCCSCCCCTGENRRKQYDKRWIPAAASTTDKQTRLWIFQHQFLVRKIENAISNLTNIEHECVDLIKEKHKNKKQIVFCVEKKIEEEIEIVDSMQWW